MSKIPVLLSFCKILDELLAEKIELWQKIELLQKRVIGQTVKNKACLMKVVSGLGATGKISSAPKGGTKGEKYFHCGTPFGCP